MRKLGWVALVASFATACAGVARAHGPAPAALAVLDWDDAEASLVRLNVGLARRLPDGHFRFICPALWGDERGAPAAPLADGETVVAASSGLFLLSADGTLRRHPDSNAGGAFVDLVRGGEQLYALRVAAGQSEVLAIDAERARPLWRDAEVFFSVAADDRQLLLLRATKLSLAWQWLDLSGIAQDAGQVALPLQVDYAFARANRELGYALVLEHGRPELGRLASAGWVSIAKAASSIAGPLAVDGVDLLAVDGQLMQLSGDAPLPFAEGPYLTCLDELDGLAYACTRDGLAHLAVQGVGEPLFTLSQLAPPDLSAATDDAQREKCDYQWQDLRFDLLERGVEVSLDTPAADGGVEQDAAISEDAGVEKADAARPASRSGGCSALPSSGAQPLLALLLGLCLRYARRRNTLTSTIVSVASPGTGRPTRCPGTSHEWSAHSAAILCIAFKQPRWLRALSGARRVTSRRGALAEGSQCEKCESSSGWRLSEALRPRAPTTPRARRKTRTAR